MSDRYLMITPETGEAVLRSLSLPARLAILKLLHAEGPKNVNEIAEALGTPQSSTSTHVAKLEAAGLIATENRKASKGSQKICRAVREEIVLSFATGHLSPLQLIK